MRWILTRLFFAFALVTVAAPSWSQLVVHIRWDGYARFADEVREGRFEVADLALLEPVLTRVETVATQPCSVLDATPLLTLDLYATDLRIRQAQEAAAEEGAAERRDALEADLQMTQRLVAHALSCRPTDGDLWLTLALFARVLGAPEAEVTRYLAMSRKHAPHEDLIAQRRDALF